MHNHVRWKDNSICFTSALRFLKQCQALAFSSDILGRRILRNSRKQNCTEVSCTKKVHNKPDPWYGIKVFCIRLTKIAMVKTLFYWLNTCWQKRTISLYTDAKMHSCVMKYASFFGQILCSFKRKREKLSVSGSSSAHHKIVPTQSLENKPRSADIHHLSCKNRYSIWRPSRRFCGTIRDKGVVWDKGLR